MTTNRRLPPGLAARPFFTVAEAVELGVSRRTLARLPRPHRGVLGHHLPTTVLEDAQALSLVLPPGCSYSHLTAAWLLGLPVPWRWSARERPHLDVACYGRTPPRRERVDGHRLNRPDLPTVMLPELSVPVLDAPHVFRQLHARAGAERPRRRRAR
ncbi:hypothetical protein [Arsenicicoccus dermatophilus]|uniref:hypothetical protein n=1 Tax=Arsenicicoccus dermatophilus TaxID=1076331 RepID=UPI0039171D31